MKTKLLFIKYFDDLNIRPFPKAAERLLQVYPSLGIGYLAAFLRQAGFEVEILDVYALNLSPREVQAAVMRSQPAIVGITSTTIGWAGAVEAAHLVKQVLPQTLVVAGGPHLSLFPAECLSFPAIDIGVYGDGEESLLELALRFEAGETLEGVAGTVTKSGGEVQVHPPRPWVTQLDKLPFPAVDLLPLERYHCLTIERPFFTLISSRGCPYQCAFCTQVFCGDKVRFRSADNVAQEIEIYLKRYKARELIMFDETFTLKKANVLKLCQIILEHKWRFRWNIRTRVDTIDAEMMEALKAAGCYGLHMGVESGDERILKLMRKGITLDQVHRAFATARRLGFMTRGYFMLGYLDEDENAFKATVKLARELPLDWASFSITTPLPGTELFTQAVERGYMPADYWKDYTLGKMAADAFPHLHTPERDELKLKAMLRQAYRSFYFRPGLMVRKLSQVRSLRALRELWEGAAIARMLEG